jgi:hypothetical protein
MPQGGPYFTLFATGEDRILLFGHQKLEIHGEQPVIYQTDEVLW